MEPKIITISIPEYKIDSMPDYQLVGSKIDEAVQENFEGSFLCRELSMIDHPQLSIDEFIDIILKTGIDKYDPNRTGVGHQDFEPYQADLQAGEIAIQNGKLTSEPFREDVKRFYENTMLDRGYRLRIDIVVLYDPEQMIRAEKPEGAETSVQSHLEQYLWRFKNPENKSQAVKGIIKILQD